MGWCVDHGRKQAVEIKKTQKKEMSQTQIFCEWLKLKTVLELYHRKEERAMFDLFGRKKRKDKTFVFEYEPKEFSYSFQKEPKNKQHRVLIKHWRRFGHGD